MKSSLHRTITGMDAEGKSKRFKLSFDGKELALFIGGIGVICLLLFLYGLNVGRNRALMEVEARAVHRPAAPPVQQGEPASQKKEETPPEVEEEQVAGVGDKDVKVGELTFYQTLPDKEAQPQDRRLPEEPVAESGTVEPAQKKEPGREEAVPAPAAIAEAEQKVRAAAGEEHLQGSVYTVQVSSFRDWARAMALKKRLVQAGYGAYVTQSGSGAGEARFRVRVGSFRGRKEAEQVARRIGVEESLPAFAVLVAGGAAR